MMTRVLAFALCAVALAPLALSACPTRADLAEGVVLVQNTPHFVRSDYESARAQLFYRSEMRRDEMILVETGYLDHALAPQEIDIDGARESFTYAGDVALFDHLDQLGSVEMEARHTLASGEDIDMTLRAEVMGHSEIELAECRYLVWDIAYSRLREGMPAENARLAYAPDLGLVLAVYVAVPGGTLQPVVTYQWAGTAADVRR